MKAVRASEPRWQNSEHCSVIVAAAANLLMTNIYETKSSITNTAIFIVIVIMYIISLVSHNHISKGLHVELKVHAVC